ncbi:hypothetical protein, partial [Nocardia amamiensis]|uniref:hypothetical protein n=1 Tax=Nocardia amamiensis TaxID=404578 RepID=UPI0034719BE5
EGRELARIQQERDGVELTVEQQRERELDARERILLEAGLERTMRGLELGIEAPERVRELDTRLLELEGRELARIQQERDGVELTVEQQRERELDARERVARARERDQLTRVAALERDGRQIPDRVRYRDARELELNNQELVRIKEERAILRAGNELSPLQKQALEFDRRQGQEELARIAEERARERDVRDPVARLLQERGLNSLALQYENRMRAIRERLARKRAARERDRGRELDFGRDIW